VIVSGCAAAGRNYGGDGQVGSDAMQPGQDGQVKHDAAPPTDAAPQADAAVDCSSGCQGAPGPCYDAPGVCDVDVCVFPFKGEGVYCADSDPCTVLEQCDGQGHCVGSPRTCDFPNASGGTCTNGACQGVVCAAGYKDCNNDLDLDGCETNLKTSSDCGDCDVPCSAGAHATASCATGTCVQACTSPWQNCDGNGSNGCEIPVGVAYQCSTNGLDSAQGCGTAYCGAGGDQSFAGNWYCSWCTSCKEFGPSSCSWCSSSTGLWLWPSGTTCTGSNPCGCPGGTYCEVECSP